MPNSPVRRLNQRTMSSVLQGVPGSSDQMGGSVSGAGDVNNDGFPDIIVGARIAGPPGVYEGAAYVYSGKDGKLLWEYASKALAATV